MRRPFQKSLWLAIFVPLCLTAADDPFVGTWRYRPDQEQFHPTYKFLAMGENKFQTDNGVALGPVLPTGGSVQQSPLGGTVSLKQIDNHTFVYVLRRQTTYRRVITLDGDTMKWDEDQELDTRKHSVGQSMWRRIGKGNGLAGEWEITSHQNPSLATARLIIRKTSDGLSFQNSDEKLVERIYFDGNDHASTDPNDIQGITRSTERVDSRTIRFLEKRNGKRLDTITFALSADGKLMAETMTEASGKMSTRVWERVDP